MKFLNFIVEGTSEEVFVNDVLVQHFAALGIYVSCRKIATGWDSRNGKPAKGGLLKYSKLKADITNWIVADRGRADVWYTTMIDLYAFPKDSSSPYNTNIQNTPDPYQKIQALETEIGLDINCTNFIPYVQLHEFEAFIMVDVNRLKIMYPDGQANINRLKSEIGGLEPELINDSYQTAPSKRIIKYFPEYEGQKAQVGPLVAEDIGMDKLRMGCPHFNEWISKLENI